MNRGISAWVIILTALLGCSGTGARSTPYLRDVARSESPNGLLFPPEIWSNIEPSTAATLHHAIAAAAIGVAVTMPAFTSEQIDQLVSDEGFAGACALLAANHLTTYITFDTAAQEMANLPTIPNAHRQQLADVLALAIAAGWRFTDTSAITAGPPSTGNATLPSSDVADSLIATYLGHQAPTPTSQGWIDSFQQSTAVTDPLAASIELRDWAQLYGSSGLRSHFRMAFWQPLIDRASSDDSIFSNLVVALAGLGQRAAAVRLFDRFDAERLRQDGSVLAIPQFLGSLGSTYRFARFDRERSGALPAALRASLIKALEAQSDLGDLDELVRSAALAELGSDLSTRRTELAGRIASAAKSAGEYDLTKPLTGWPAVRDWISLRELSQSLGQPLAFTGFTADFASAAILDNEDTALVAALLLGTLGRTDVEPHPEIGVLVSSLATFVAKADPATLSSLVLFRGADAVHTLTDVWPVPHADLVRIERERVGSCLGGYESFVRLQAPAGGSCDLESSRSAERIVGAAA